MISREDVKKLATLARINLSAAEEENLAKDMESILGYVAQIQEVQTEAPNPTKGPRPRVRNVLRDDTNPHEPGAFTEEILAEAPKRKAQYVEVKKIL